MKKYAVIVAGGSGLRMGTAIPKQFLMLHGRPVLWYTLSTFLKAYDDLNIILVIPESHMSTGHAVLATLDSQERITIQQGGETRFDSVKNGLKNVPYDAIVFVHDGVRCLLSVQLIHACYEAALSTGNAVPAIVPADSIRTDAGGVNGVIDRNSIRLIQTPQTFHSTILKKAFDQEYRESFSDEATVLESIGHTINLIEGERTNIKITHPFELLFAEQILLSASPNK